VGCGWSITRWLCHSFFLTLCPSSSVGSFPRGAVPQEQTAPACVLHEVTSPASKPALAWAPPSTGPQVLPGVCSIVGSPQGHSPLWASPYSGMGSSLGCRWRSSPPWPMVLPAFSPCLAMFCSMAAEESLFWCLEHLLPSFCTDPGVCRVVALTSHSCLWLQLQLHRFFPSSVRYPRGVTTIADGLRLGQRQVHLGVGGIGFVGHGGSFQRLLAEAIPSTLPRKSSTTPNGILFLGPSRNSIS